MSGILEGLAGWVTGLVESLGYTGVALVMLLENLFPPIPSELVLPLAGYLVSQGRFSYLGMLLVATAGSLVSALILYGLGRWFGEERLRSFVRRYGRLLFLREADVDKAERWFIRHGAKAVLIGRLVPVVRSAISLPAGVAEMPVGQFIVLTLIGSGVWNALLIGLGWVLGESWELVAEYVKVLEYAALLGIAVGVVWFLWNRLGGRRRRALT